MYPNNKRSEFDDAFAAAGMGGQQYPFMYPNPYMPAQFGLQGNSDMGGLIAMFAGPLMGAMAGPENFIPQLMPSQHLMDSYAMRNYQQEMMHSSLQVAESGRGAIAKRALGLRSAFTDDPVTQLTREQADTAANVLSNPIVKAIAGSIIGPETYEAAMYGSKGDMSALNSAIAKTGFFRTNPTGGGRMDANTLTAYTESMYAHLYEPAGNLDDLEADARKGRGVNPFRNRRIKQAQDKLKDVAGMQDSEIVSDEDVASRMENMENSSSRVSQLYKKYVKDGSAVTTAEQAKELVKYERAVKEAGVLDDKETTIGQLRREAERAPVKRLHGFMGSQVGEMQRELFEQGMLPQSLGDMSVEDRMRTVSDTKRDDETMERLARKMARDELEKDPTFKKMSTEQQDRLIESKMPENVRTLRKTETELGKHVRGESGAMSAEDLEKQGGMNLMTVDADAKRAGTTVEKYSGALAAVRKLFGDNGNPNAPVPSLIKMLNALTNGSMGQFEPGRVEAELRKMQTLAKETGVGLQQLADISTNVTNQGRMLGLSDATSVQATNATLAGIKVMREQGMFATNQFGTQNQAQMSQSLGEDMQRGAASNNAKAMAAMVRVYEADPKAYAGTELEAAVQAYKDPNSQGVYTDPVTGQQKNLYRDVGTYGPAAAREIVANANDGAGLAGFDLGMLDPLTEEYAIKDRGFMTQKYEGHARLRNMLYETTRDTLQSDKNKHALSTLDTTDREQTMAMAGEVMSTMIVDTALKNKEDRNKYFADNLEIELEQKFIDEGIDPAEAARRAKELAPILADPTNIENSSTAAGAMIARETEGRENLRSYAQKRGEGRPEAMAEESGRAAKRAEQKAAADLGYENTPVQRASDYLAEIHDKGEKFTTSGLMDAIMPTIKNEKVAREFMEKLEPGFETLSDMMGDVFVTDSYIDDLAKNDNFSELKKLADPEGKTFTADTKILSGKQLEAARDRVIAEKFKGADGKLDSAAIDTAYSAANLGKGVGMSAEEKLAELKTHDDFLSHIDDDVFAKEGAVSEDRLVREARGSRGKAREGMEQRAEDLVKVQAGLFYGSDPEKLRQGVSAAFRSLDISRNDEYMKKIQDLTLDTSEEGKKKLQAEIDDLWVDDEKKEKLRTMLTSMQESAALDPAATGLTDEAGKLQQTADGVVDKTNIEAQTVVLNASRYVDKDGKPLFSDSERGTAIQQNSGVREAAEQMVAEHYSDTGFMGNSTPFSDAEVEDAATRLSDTLGIPKEDATAIMKSIQAEKQENMTASTVVSWMYGDNTKYTDDKRAKNDSTARDIIIRDYSDKKSFSEKDMAAAAKKVAAAGGISLEEAQESLTRELEKKKVRVDKPGTGPQRDRPLSDNKPTAEEVRRAVEAVTAGEGERQAASGPAVGGKPLTEAERHKKYDYDRLGVKKTVTAEQQAVIDRVSTDPTGKKFASEMSSVFGGKTREAMFTLSDDAAIDLFRKFDPEAQKRGLQQLKEAQSNTMLTETQRANAGRLYDAISAAQASEQQKGTQVAASEKTKKTVTEREKESVRQATGVEYATLSQDEVRRLMSDPATMEHAVQTGKETLEQATRRISTELAGTGLTPDKAGTEAVRALSEKSREIDTLVATSPLSGEQKKRGRSLDTIEQMTSEMAPMLTATSSGGKSEPMKISGTLSLNGLQEVLLTARGQQSVPTDGMGPPVIMDPPSMYTNPMAPQRPV